MSEELNVSRIVGLHTENVMRLKAVDLTPPEHLVAIGGDNDQGKSSLLLSIEMALAGADVFPEMPVRKGQKRAVVDLDLGDLKVHRTISSSGSTTLTVRAKDGTALDSPQKILDALRGKRSFDPMEFMRLKEAEQAETLRRIAGLDLSALDAEYKRLYEERTQVNREVAQKQAQLLSLGPAYPEAGEVEVSAAELMAEQQKAVEQNAERARIRSEFDRKASNLREFAVGTDVLRMSMDACEKEIESLKKRITEAERRHAGLQSDIKARDDEHKRSLAILEEEQKSLATLQDIPVGQFREKLRAIEDTNRRARHNLARRKASEDYEAAKKRADEFTNKLSAIETQKNDAIQAAKFPVPGLGFMDSGAVAYNGVPFAQASTSVQLKVSVAIGLALNPKLRILLIRNGNDLDEANMKLLADMAREHKAQVWIERVQKSGDVAVIIQDGTAVTPKPAEQTQQPLV